MHLWAALRRNGISTFLDERSILLGQQSEARMKAACFGAKLVIFVVDRHFLRSTWCLKELGWALDARKQSGGHLPEIVTELYPNGEHTISISDLKNLSLELCALIEAHNKVRLAWSEVKALLSSFFSIAML